VLNQTLKPLEVIVIDDGSENNEAEIITNNFISQTEIPITYKKKKNGGPSSARNLGISLAKGEFILFIDSDDELLSNSLEWREEILDSIDKDYASIFCSRVECIEKKSNITLDVPEIDGKLDVCLVGRKNGIPGQITNYLFRKDILTAVEGYNESLKFNEDFDLILRIAKIKMFRGINRVGFIQHIRENSWSKSDPYVTFNGVEEFLDNAFDKKLLPINEIEQRRKDNRLTLVKKLLVKRSKWKDAVPYINEAFDIIKPVNFKEFILFLLNKILKRL
jgi:glycosyltransferase involved in cell wall biosynthesis